jgi:repressor LexA
MSDTTEAIYDFVRDSIVNKQMPPSRREIQEATGVKSTSTVSYHLEKLQEQGRIKLYPGFARGIAIIDQGGDA